MFGDMFSSLKNAVGGFGGGSQAPKDQSQTPFDGYGSEGPGGITGHAQDPGFGQISQQAPKPPPWIQNDYWAPDRDQVMGDPSRWGAGPQGQQSSPAMPGGGSLFDTLFGRVGAGGGQQDGVGGQPWWMPTPIMGSQQPPVGFGQGGGVGDHGFKEATMDTRPIADYFSQHGPIMHLMGGK